MHMSKFWVFTVLAVLISVALAEWQVLNDESDGERDDFLESEHFIPADALSKQNSKASQRNLASVKQNGQQGKVTNTDLKVTKEAPVPPKAEASLTSDLKSSTNANNNADVKKMSSTSQTASANKSGASATKSGPVHIGAAERDSSDDDDVDLATEGFLLAEPEKKPQKGHAASTRKLAQVDETYSEESYRTRNVKLMSEESLSEDSESDSNATPPKRDVDILEDLKIPSNSSSPSSESASSTESSSSSSMYSASHGHHEVKPHIAEGRQPANDRLLKLRKDRVDRKSRLLELESLDEEEFQDQDWVELNIVCMDKSSWECLMFKEDYLASRHDTNLSNRGNDRVAQRVRRQVNSPDDNIVTEIDAGSGNETVFSEVVVEEPDYIFDSSSSFSTKETPESLDKAKKEKIKDELDRQLRELFKGLKGFVDVIVDPDSIRVVNGTLIANWRVKLNSGAPEFSSLDPSVINDTLRANLDNIKDGYKDNIKIDGLGPLDDFDFDNILNQLNEQLTNPCNNTVNPNPCSVGYHNCEVTDSIQIKCYHKCYTFNNKRPCEHGGTCDLNMNNEPYCSCTRNWKGEYCQEKRKDNKLDGGEISGIVIGGILVTAGCIGCCCWFLLCFRKDHDMIYTHYTDEEGSGRFSAPSAQLGAVIDRPHISVSPISVFKAPSVGGGVHRQFTQTYSDFAPSQTA